MVMALAELQRMPAGDILLRAVLLTLRANKQKKIMTSRAPFFSFSTHRFLFLDTYSYDCALE